MLIDQELMFSDAQSLRSTQESTHTVDLTAAGDAGLGRLVILAHADTAFVGATQIECALQTADDADFATGVTTLASVTVSDEQLADTTQNLFALAIPAGMKRYLRMYYTVTGTVTAGEISCCVVDIAETK